MRILHTAMTYSPSLDGVAEVVRHISEELTSRGHEVHIATSALPDEPRQVTISGVNVHRFPARGNAGRGLEGAIREYRGFVEVGRWDIVVNHCLQAWTTDALLDDIEKFSWPSILVTHGMSTDDPAFSAYYGAMPTFISKYAAWVTVSGQNEEWMFAQQNALARPTLIRNGVDLSEWRAGAAGTRERWRKEQRFWVVNVSNHLRQKRHEWVFELARRLRGVDAKLTIIGNFNIAGRATLSRLGVRGGCFYDCRVRALASRSVDLKTAVPRRDVVSAICEADLLVSTSRWEANSVVLLESMAAGTPWVSTDVGSARDNAGGVVADSFEHMVDAVKALLKDPDRRKQLGHQGRERAVEAHDWGRIVDQYEELYKSAIEQRGLKCLHWIR